MDPPMLSANFASSLDVAPDIHGLENPILLHKQVYANSAQKPTTCLAKLEVFVASETFAEFTRVGIATCMYR